MLVHSQAASIRAVALFLFFGSTPAPLSSNTRTTGVFPAPAARINGVAPSVSRASMSAPFSISTFAVPAGSSKMVARAFWGGRGTAPAIATVTIAGAVSAIANNASFSVFRLAFRFRRNSTRCTSPFLAASTNASSARRPAFARHPAAAPYAAATALRRDHGRPDRARRSVA